MSHRRTVDALVERWHLEMHTFHLSHGECTITLEGIEMIFGLRTDGLLVTGSINHTISGLENECLARFGIAPGPNDHKGSRIKLAWFRTLKWHQHLTDQFSWGSACLAHMYQSLCQALRYDCKDIDDPLALLLVWNDYQPTIEHYKNWTTSNVRRSLDDLPPDEFVWENTVPTGLRLMLFHLTLRTVKIFRVQLYV
ncbi:uncharacterized protein DS421_20g704200 [Arachis hypogaea]|nr:uncharacterized protein DS421_20g704200 [Arachis hypogaea]